MTIDTVEVQKFAQHATQWWNKNGPLKTLHDINPVRINYVEKFVSFPGLTVLDVGCGGGILSEEMAANGAKVTGLDVEPAAIAAAQAHAVERQLSIQYECLPIEAFEGGPYDVVTCMEMLEHVSDPQLVIDHCARLLKPGGYLFLSTINRTFQAYTSVVIAAEYLLGILPRQTHDYDKFIKPSELSSMLRGASLETVGMSGLAYNPCTRVAHLQKSVGVNYLLASFKPPVTLSAGF